MNQITAVRIRHTEYYTAQGLKDGHQVTINRYTKPTADQPRRRASNHTYCPVSPASLQRLRRLLATDDWTRPTPRNISPDDVLRHYPRLVSHVICHSLGYATPKMAASIIAAAARDDAHYCEWINHCYRDDPRPAVRHAIQGRHTHRGYMAHYPHARALVAAELAGNGPLFASWF